MRGVDAGKSKRKTFRISHKNFISKNILVKYFSNVTEIKKEKLPSYFLLAWSHWALRAPESVLISCSKWVL